MRRRIRSSTVAGVLVSVLTLAASVPAAVAWSQQDRAGGVALRTGRYEEAISLFTTRVRSGRGAPADYRGLARALRNVGRYQEAELAARDYITSNPTSPDLWNTLGETFYLRGKLDEAEQAYRKAILAHAPDQLIARLNLAILRFDRGDRSAAMREFDRFIDVYNNGNARSAEELTAVGIACRYLGNDDPDLFKDAVQAYEDAIAADPSDPEPRERLGELFLEKYNSTEADALFREVLVVNPHHTGALLGMARRMEFDGSPEAPELIQRALEVNPNLVAARVLRAKLLLGREEYALAAAETKRALEINPASLEAIATLAATHYLGGDHEGYQEAKDRALALNPRYADLYNTLADLCVQNRLYEQAVIFAHAAIELDPESWRGFGLLGLNQLRLGSIEEGRGNLEVAFEGDPYNVWTKNTLDLLDTFSDYAETSTPRFKMMIEAPEAALLSPYLGDLAEEAYEQLAERYQYRPPTPIRIEVYRSHADFSVRTVGLAGLGALGVSFGPVVAIDSPSAREIGQFNWGSTVWHEIAHTFTLGVTDHRIPRWLSEGLSVYEERRARRGWGDDVSIGFLLAVLQHRLHPVSQLTEGFVRPSYPEQLAYSYYQASLVCELIERDYGFETMLAMLAGYKHGKTTAEVFEQALNTDQESFDRRFDSYVEDRFAGPLAALEAAALRTDPAHTKNASSHPPSLQELEQRALADDGDFVAQLAWGTALFRQDKPGAAEPFIVRAKQLFPRYAEADSPYWYLAKIFESRGELRKAAAELSALISINEKSYRSHLELASLLEQLGDTAGAADVLDRALFITPFETPVHGRLAELYASVGVAEKAIRERRAVLALDPVDRAEALYRLALAYSQAGDDGEAKRQVLKALEIAPSFEGAQDLLLKLVGKGTGGAMS
ncbi:MAG: tetratricopeptide repeat protein [Acidobacteriota bacterium]